MTPTRPDDLPALTVTTLAQPQAADHEAVIEAIVQVRQADYVPRQVTVRAWVDSTLFTCAMRAEDLSTVQDDPQVVSVAPSTPLRLIE